MENNINILAVKELMTSKDLQGNLREISLTKEIDVGRDLALEIGPKIEEEMMITDSERNMKMNMTSTINQIQQKDLIDM